MARARVTSGLIYYFQVLLVSLFVFAPSAVFSFGTTACVQNGQEIPNTLQTVFGCIQTGSALSSFVERLYAVALFLGATLAVIMIILGGIQYIASSGNPESIQAARDRITSALLGLGLLLLAAVLFRTLGGVGAGGFGP